MSKVSLIKHHTLCM